MATRIRGEKEQAGERGRSIEPIEMRCQNLRFALNAELLRALGQSTLPRMPTGDTLESIDLWFNSFLLLMGAESIFCLF